MKGDCSLIDVLRDYDAEQAEHDFAVTNFHSQQQPGAVLKDFLMAYFVIRPSKLRLENPFGLALKLCTMKNF